MCLGDHQEGTMIQNFVQEVGRLDQVHREQSHRVPGGDAASRDGEWVSSDETLTPEDKQRMQWNKLHYMAVP